MARKLRLEFPGAIYHVLNRGNYRSWIFRDPKTRAAFQACLFEACERSNWSFALETALQAIQKSHADIDGDRKSAP